MPFVIDPSGLFAAEGSPDYTLGERVGLTQTATIFNRPRRRAYTQVTDVNSALPDARHRHRRSWARSCNQGEDHRTQIARIGLRRSPMTKLFQAR